MSEVNVVSEAINEKNDATQVVENDGETTKPEPTVTEIVKDTLSLKESVEIVEDTTLEVNNHTATVQEEIEEKIQEESRAVENVITSEVSSIKEEVHEEVKKESIPEPAKIVEETKEVVTNEAFDCVIIVGAFEEVSNRKAIIQKLKSLGYPYSHGVLRKGLNYVGVPVNCNDKQEKRRLLNELNEAFGIESWVKKI